MSGDMRRRRTENVIPESDDSYDPWMSVIGKVTYAVLTHPVDYAKVLIQIGFEPMEPVPSRTLFRKPVLRLPGIITYLGHIRRVDGILGLYRGLVPSIAGRLLHDSCYNFVLARSPPIASFEEDQAIATDSEKILNFVKRTSQQSIAYIAAITISQPFRVITIRMMAQFIGRETKYSAFSSLIDIYKEEGLSGLFSGLLPRIYGDTLRIWLAATATFFITNFIIQDKQTNHYVSGFCTLVASAWTYPFLLVSTVMSVSGAPIAAGRPPHVAVYCNWTQCYTHLKKHEQLKRGSSLLWRYYYPIKVSQGIAYKTDLDISSLD